MKESSIYSSLAPLYDRLMEDVDYEAWADYIDELLQIHHPDPVHILELACGTGSVALSLDELGYYQITATDLSADMIGEAEKKKAKVDSGVRFRTMNFLDIDLNESFDAIYSVFDSVNYLDNAELIRQMLLECQKVLKPDGLLIFDFSTPRNSMEAVDYLNNEEAQIDHLRYFRTSRYDPREQIHYNEFEIEELSPSTGEVIGQYREIHKQRIYSLDEMLSILDQTPYHLVAKYADFSLLDADKNSARVTIILSCQKQPSLS